MDLPEIITPAEAKNIERPKKQASKPSLLPAEIEEQAKRFLNIVNNALKNHYRGAPLLVPTGSLGNEALKICEEALHKAGWDTKRTKEGEDWLLRLTRGEYGKRSNTDFE